MLITMIVMTLLTTTLSGVIAFFLGAHMRDVARIRARRPQMAPVVYLISEDEPSVHRLCETTLQTHAQLATQLRVPELFASCDARLNGRKLRGVAVFQAPHLPSWEDADPNGCDLSWYGAVDAASVTTLWILAAALCTQPGVVGCRLINKNKPGMPMVKVEVWLPSAEPAKVRVATCVLRRVAKKMNLPGAATQFGRAVTHGSKLSRSH
jgi:hypothetical protein